MNTLLMMMGGSGTRFGADIPKQYILINDAPVFYHILKKYLTCPEIDQIIIVSHKDWIPYVEEQVQKLAPAIPCMVTAGGATRSESVKNGLCLANSNGNSDDVVLIHDATHPYVDSENLSKIIEAVKECGGATLGGSQYDTMYETTTESFLKRVIPRQYVVSGASPEAFRLGDLYHIYCNASQEELEQMTSAGAIALAHGIPMKVIPSNVLNLKITHPDDMRLFRCLIDQYFFTN